MTVDLIEFLKAMGADAIEIPPDRDFEGWWCVNITPVRCRICGEIVTFLQFHPFHLILVWEERDHKDLLDLCIELKRRGYDPQIRPYHVQYGSCAPFEMMVEFARSRSERSC